MMTSTSQTYADLRTRLVSGNDSSGFEATIQSEANSSVVNEQREEIAYLAVLSSPLSWNEQNSSEMMMIELMMPADSLGRTKKVVTVPLSAQSIVGKVSEKVTQVNLPWTQVGADGDDNNDQRESSRGGSGTEFELNGGLSSNKLYKLPSTIASVSSFIGGDPVHVRVDALSMGYMNAFLGKEFDLS